MKWNDLEPKVMDVRQKLLGIFNSIERNQNPILPAKDKELDAAFQLISNETFDVLVCGEVKKGKSSFINAVIGENILPTNTNVATSQVFRIVNSDAESYSIVFTDGTSQPITREQLSLYGSQVDADLYGEPIFKNHTLDHIEVNYPITFLPKSVTIVDTPGIGALYAAHERITTEYLKKASAVIFVMDPANPLVEQERQFLEKAFAITDQIMFVMTKMDNYDEHYIVQMIRRNEELLQPFRDKIYNGCIQVFPMSSKTLADAAHEDIEILRNDCLCASQFEQVKSELLRLVYSTVGISRNIYAFNVANDYHAKVLTSIDEQTKVLSSPEYGKELIQKRQALQNDFALEWGSRGTKQKEIIDKTNDCLVGFQNQVTALFLQNGRVYTQFLKEIESLSKSDEDIAYGKALPARLQTEIGQSWKGLLNDCQSGIQSILVNYDQEAKKYIEDACGDSAKSERMSIPFEVKKTDFWQQFNELRSSYFTAMFGSAVLGALTIPVAGWVLLPIAIIIVIFESERNKHMRIQNDLKKCLYENFTKVHHAFTIEPISKEEPITMTQKVVREITKMSQNALTQIYDQRKAFIDKEMAQLSEQIKKAGEERKIAMQNLDSLHQSWKPVYLQLLETKKLISELSESLK